MHLKCIICYVLLIDFYVYSKNIKVPGRLHFNKKNEKYLPDFKILFIKQKVDHFGFANNDTFLLRYLVCDKYWKGGNRPIFFYTGNEGDITLFYENTGLMFDWAEEFNALIVFGEHRYYGTSMPYGKDSYKDPQHLNYLTAGQALADYVSLLEHVKKTTAGAKESPVIAFGGSYGGMLAAWMRMKFPFSILGSVAASAPIWSIAELTPCGDFLKLVTKDFKISGANCDETIRRSWKAIDQVAVLDKGLEKLSDIFGLCTGLKKTQDLKDWLVEIWTNLAMIDYPYSANFLEPLPAWPIKVVCTHLQKADLPAVELLISIRNAVDVYFNYTGSSKCYQVEDQGTPSLGTLGWDYQACTEMIMSSCSNGVDDMFEPSAWNESAYSDECYRKWKVRPNSDTIIRQFGGKNIEYASNIIFSNGLLDPWSTGGVLESKSKSLVSVIIKSGAHHLDLRSQDSLDPPDVVEARIVELLHVKEWIDEYYESKQLKNSNEGKIDKIFSHQANVGLVVVNWTRDTWIRIILILFSITLTILVCKKNYYRNKPGDYSKVILM